MLVTPGSTHTRWLARSTSSTRFIRETTISTPSATGSAPPDSPEPAPRATHGTPASAHARTAWTSSAVPGSTAAAGMTCPVLEQAVGLVGPQLVLGRVDPVLADDAAQLADEVREVYGIIHPSTEVDCRYTRMHMTAA